MHEITVPWAKLQFPDKWLDMYECEIWDQVTCPKGGTAIDIGAHYGFYTTKMAQEAGLDGKVLAFEPDVTNREILQRNLKQNDLTCEIFHCAISDYEGTGVLLTYGQVDNDSGKHFLRGSNTEQAYDTEYRRGDTNQLLQRNNEVMVTTLDKAVYSLSRIDLIKMDIEGAELKALQGGHTTLQKYNPRIVMEVHFNQLNNLKKYLNSIGYSLAKYYDKVTDSSNQFAVFEKEKA